MSTFREDVILELHEMSKLGICSKSVAARAKRGEFDDTIQDCDNMKSSDLASLIVDLS